MQMSSATITSNREKRITALGKGHPNTEQLVIGMLISCKNEDQERLLANLAEIGLRGHALYLLIMDYARDIGLIDISPSKLSDGSSLYPVSAHYDIRTKGVLEKIIDAVLDGKLKEFYEKMLLRK